MGQTLVPPEDRAPYEPHEIAVRARGEIDMASAPGLREALVAAIKERPHTVVVDLTEVTFMDSSGLDALIAAKRTAEKVDVAFELSSPSAHCRTVLEITGLDTVFMIRR